ncbi:hypothetical protein OHS33_39160 (plasmid) [Streptomyces sp. NBC_00536]|uniref:hypothetical protein n=1 Tax=Streptomyces sp. NBC_00536 TaxID=2975769 RepID=UPI002E8123C4|nr:hypothetical protein [Streptomyces sp. NBC_00536]WUC84379.1 hypothetical protein OHS33_39160 [Streptomyces sp. NBC_00536]
MPVIDATFYPLIVTERPDNSLYRMPPAGTSMGAARLCPITEVRPGDWVLGSHERALNPNRLDTLMQSAACFPALPATVNGAVALDGQSDVWDDTETALVIPREYIPAETYANRLDGYRLGDHVERAFIYDPMHADLRDSVGTARPLIQRGIITAVEDDAFTVEWAGYWANGRITETAMRLTDPAAVARERAAYGFAVGDTVHQEKNGLCGPYATGVVLELYYSPYGQQPMARVFWPGSAWDNYCHYDFVATHLLSHAVPANRYDVTSRQQYAPTA